VERYICIHGHFYQPPRENPWLEEIETQDSAYPYHDWNERIAAECYAPNAASRILDGAGRIACIVNNYSRISFNFGPTLLAWMEEKRPDVYAGILEADAESRRIFGGHGAAMAQPYNHMIMPLASRRDKYTQIVWGLRDFERRFRRWPEGIWLPETAVDLETLAMVEEFGIRFTVLSPYQAHRVRAIGSRLWKDVSGGRVDPSTAYRVNLRGGRHIHVFFYDGPISRAVAFEGLLLKGEYLADRLNSAFSDARPWAQLVHIATDGETYGHHRRKADMGLAYALHYIEEQKLARLTNYAEFLEKHPATHEATVFENSAWSCSHGVERWKSACGCASGMRPEWSQGWRQPLREALDWLRDTLAPVYSENARKYLVEPWEARDEYINAILDRTPENVDRFLAQHALRELAPAERTAALRLLEMQRHAMLMYTSCGWFFDDLSGIETVQVIQYAARALQLAEPFFKRSLEPRFLELLERAQSNVPEHGNGRKIYEKFVRPSMLDLRKVGAHYAVSSLFEPYGTHSRVFCYNVEREDFRTLMAGRAKLVLGKANVISGITGESERLSFGVLHLGEHNVSGGIRAFRGDNAYEETVRELSQSFHNGDLAAVLNGVSQHFEAGTYSLKLLFRDEQRRILRFILESSLARAEASYRHIFGTDAPLMQFVRSLGMPLPNRFRMAADFCLNTDLRAACEKTNLNVQRVRELLAEASRLDIALDSPTIEYALRRTVERLATFLAKSPSSLPLIGKLNDAVALARSLPFEVDLWTAQNVYYRVLRGAHSELGAQADGGDATASAWVGQFLALGENLSFRME
jgi:alpha-amylase/alpha-mannosidase (GH57 family)